ncbi:MarR family winged helix-turn-helix transcriptional regulator [Salinispora sp. H7-4]|uniref:MarR family winged helix-turn-helix transcriptional regulator n=1 Tax=Salinispora sp. H7-4 TaxID=2748321 RepID=UPI0015D1B1DC|nr:MarR family winged helix-turn-helix transcriptional regulator [Salinispora sp. H7-4]NYT95806.1 winged helix-turn-helix transcriptional regulator [Salinispora sp. H7-4]
MGDTVATDDVPVRPAPCLDPASTAALGAVVGELHRRLRRAAARHANCLPLPEAQVELLLLVRAHPDVSVKDAACRLHAAPNTVSTLVRDLVAAGLLHRECAPADRRTARLRLTDAAHARIADHEEQRAALLSAAVSHLSPEARAAVLAATPHLARLADLLNP